MSLGVLFLMLLAGLAILGSASRSSSQAVATREALELAREGMEQLIALSSFSPGKGYVKNEAFSARDGSVEGFTYQRKMMIVAVDSPAGKLSKALVMVDWGKNKKIKLERYVCSF